MVASARIDVLSPDTQRWRRAAHDLTTARRHHGAACAVSGDRHTLLVAGGRNGTKAGSKIVSGGVLASVEAFGVATDGSLTALSSPPPPLPSPREGLCGASVGTTAAFF
eukprot:SAG31_NODE_35120_length_326_cov_0.682819_1_plen_108_part_11